MEASKADFLDEKWRVVRPHMSTVRVVTAQTNRLICVLQAGVQNWLDIADRIVEDHNAVVALLEEKKEK